MTRETRVNLIALVVVLVLIVPGTVLMTIKAWRGEGGLNAVPPSAKIATPYLHPVGGAADLIRVVPPETIAFVDGVAQRHAGSPAMRPDGAGGRPRPVISQNLYLELLGRAEERWIVLVWHHDGGAGAVEIVGDLAEGSEVLATEPVPVEVRQELQDGSVLSSGKGYAGYANPPRRISVVAVEAPLDVGRLELTWTLGSRQYEDALELAGVRASLRSRPQADIETDTAESAATRTGGSPHEGAVTP